MRMVLLFLQVSKCVVYLIRRHVRRHSFRTVWYLFLCLKQICFTLSDLKIIFRNFNTELVLNMYLDTFCKQSVMLKWLTWVLPSWSLCLKKRSNCQHISKICVRYFLVCQNCHGCPSRSPAHVHPMPDGWWLDCLSSSLPTCWIHDSSFISIVSCLLRLPLTSSSKNQVLLPPVPTPLLWCLSLRIIIICLQAWIPG